MENPGEYGGIGGISSPTSNRYFPQKPLGHQAQDCSQGSFGALSPTSNNYSSQQFSDDHHHPHPETVEDRHGSGSSLSSHPNDIDDSVHPQSFNKDDDVDDDDDQEAFDQNSHESTRFPSPPNDNFSPGQHPYDDHDPYRHSFDQNSHEIAGGSPSPPNSNIPQAPYDADHLSKQK